MGTSNTVLHKKLTVIKVYLCFYLFMHICLRPVTHMGVGELKALLSTLVSVGWGKVRTSGFCWHLL